MKGRRVDGEGGTMGKEKSGKEGGKEEEDGRGEREG